MAFLKKILNLLIDQRGSALFIIAAAMVSLVGFTALVTDIGLITSNKQKLVNTMDAAALSGAQVLPDTVNAEAVARSYAVSNGYVSADSSDPVITFNSGKITVAGSQNVNLAFARIFGIYNSTVSASSTAEIQALTSFKGALPLTTDTTTFETLQPTTLPYGPEFELKTGSPSIGSGNFGALSLGTDEDYDAKDPGATAYKENLINGSKQTIKVGDQLPTKPGNMDGPTSKGIKDRISCSCTHTNYTNDCPRVVVIPIFQDVPATDLNGRTVITVAGFATIFITNAQGSSVYARFISNVLKDGQSSSLQTSYGVGKPTLIQ